MNVPGFSGTLTCFIMNLYNRYISDLSRISGMSVRIENDIPKDISPFVYKQLQTRSVSGWFDSNSDCVCLYRPNIQPEESDIASNAVYLQVREKGFKSLLKDNFLNFCSDIVRDFYLGSEAMQGEEMEKMAMDYISEIPVSDKSRWNRIASRACLYAKLDKDDKMVRSMAAAHHSFIKKENWRARMNNDHEAVDKMAKESLGNLVNDNVNVSLGRCSDPYLRIGYPENELRIRSNSVRDFFQDNGILNAEGPNISRLLQEPMAIFKGEHKGEGEKTPLNIILTDHFVPGKGFLSFGVDAPETILAGYGEGKSKVNVRSVRFMSEYAVLSTLTRAEGNNICYLKPGEHHGYEISSYLRKMEGRSFSDLGKKSDDRNTPVYSPLSESRRLKTATNIVSNFRNPMAADTRKKLFGGILFEDNLRQRQDVKNEMKALAQRPVTGYSVHKAEGAGKTVNARAVYVSEKDFSKAAVDKFRKARIYSAFDIMTYGKERFAADFGTRTFKSALLFLDKHNLSFMNHSVIKRIDESELDGKDMAGQLAVVQKDMHNALSDFKSENLSRTVHFPRRIDGSYIQGAGAFVMMAKSFEMARWRDCNVFITREQAEKADIQLNRTAVPTYVVEKDRIVPYYNLSETSFATERPESFAILKEEALNRTPEADNYARSYITLLSGPGDSTYSIQQIDAAFDRRYSHDKGMVNNGSFAGHLNATFQNKLSESFSNGFMQGKAEGINMMAELNQKKEQKQQKTVVRAINTKPKPTPSGSPKL